MSVELIFLWLAGLLGVTLGGPINSTDLTRTDSSGLTRSEDTLVLLHVLFRHGNRAPDRSSISPNDLYQDENTYAPYGWGQLTLKGKRTEYAIGKYLRSTYSQFLPSQYKPNTVYALSTNFKRTKMSLELVLASLFPPQSTEIIEPGVNWQPIPINIEQEDGLINVASIYCPLYISEYCAYVKSDAAQFVIQDYEKLYVELSGKVGKTIRTPGDLSSVYFSLKSEDDFGLPLPAWAASYYPYVLEEAAAVDYEFATATPNLRRLSAGRLLQKILEDSELKRLGQLSPDRKIFLYSAHEYNIGTMLSVLNVFYRHVPPFGATIFFEIHNLSGNYALKLLYQDYKSGAPRVLTIPGCSSYCLFTDLYRLIGDNLPAEDQACHLKGEVDG